MTGPKIFLELKLFGPNTFLDLKSFWSLTLALAQLVLSDKAEVLQPWVHTVRKRAEFLP